MHGPRLAPSRRAPNDLHIDVDLSQLDIWKGPTLDGDGGAAFRVSPAEFNWTTAFLREKNLTYEVLVDNVQR